MPVHAPDGGTINAAIIEPALYDPEIKVWYKENQSQVKTNLNFPKLPAPPETSAFKQLAKNKPFATYAGRLSGWLATVKIDMPIGTVIMLPGFDMNRASLMPWALFFADRGWRVVLVDLRGQGTSSSPYLTWGIKDRDDLSRLVELLEAQHILVHPWIYFGVSYGAGVALMAAGDRGHPDGVIAIAPWETASGVIPRFAHSVAGGLAPGSASPKWVSAEQQAGRIAGINLQEARPIDSVASIPIPVLYLGGSADSVAPPENIEMMAQKTREATVAIKKGLAHIVVVADVPGFCSSINDWLSATLLKNPVRKCFVSKSVKNGLIEETYIGDKLSSESN